MVKAATLLFAALALACAAGAAASADDAARPCVGSAVVSEIYPRGDALPENLLRFYIYFTEPMEPVDISRFVALRDAGGRAIDGVFLPTRFGVWSPDGRRATLILDPGRVKSGLDAHAALGRALTAGEAYTLQVDAGVRDAQGCALSAPHDKPFRAVAADTTAPALDAWALHVPSVGGREPVSLVLNGPHDHVSLAFRLRVLDEAGAAVPGAIALSEGESVWAFTPRAPWPDAEHRLVADPALEDLAGNRLSGLFDQPGLAARASAAAGATPTLHFRPSRPSPNGQRRRGDAMADTSDPPPTTRGHP